MAGPLGQNSRTISLKTRCGEDKKTMKKNKSEFYFTTILLIHIFVYLFKIDRDVFAIQEYFSRPNQTYTEQPHSKNVSYFGNSISDFHQYSKSFDTKNNCIENIAVWNSIFLSYNSRVHHLLKQHESSSSLTIGIIAVLHRQNIFHKSSEEEEIEYCFFA
jgi:hypothetical protein